MPGIKPGMTVEQGDIMGIIAWIVVGLVAGWLANVILGGRGGLLGNLAVWSGEKVEWDAAIGEPVNRPDLAEIIQHEYREGWTL